MNNQNIINNNLKNIKMLFKKWRIKIVSQNSKLNNFCHKSISFRKNWWSLKLKLKISIISAWIFRTTTKILNKNWNKPHKICSSQQQVQQPTLNSTVSSANPFKCKSISNSQQTNSKNSEELRSNPKTGNGKPKNSKKTEHNSNNNSNQSRNNSWRKTEHSWYRPKNTKFYKNNSQKWKATPTSTKKNLRKIPMSYINSSNNSNKSPTPIIICHNKSLTISQNAATWRTNSIKLVASRTNNCILFKKKMENFKPSINKKHKLLNIQQALSPESPRNSKTKNQEMKNYPVSSSRSRRQNTT